MTESTRTEPTIAQRPHGVSRMRLHPLLALCLCVVAATVVGLVHGGSVTPDAPAAAVVNAGVDKFDRATDRKASRKCMPRWSSRVKGDPWAAGRRKASEKAFQRRIAKEHPAYVKGKDGWHFFTDYQANNFSQALGRVTQSDAKRKAWARFFKEAQRTVRKAGGSFYVVVSPAQWEIYPNKLPSWAQDLRGKNTLDRLMKLHPDLPWIDTRPALRKAASKHATYEPLNSHWTPYGGYVAWGAIARCLTSTNGELEGLGVPPLAGVAVEPNLNEFAMNGVPDGRPARTVPTFGPAHPPTEITTILGGETIPNVADHSVDAIYLPVRTTTPGAQLDKTLMVYRDSTGSALSPLWSRSFATTIQYHHGVASTAKPTKVRTAVGEFKPDVFLYVITERFLDSMPPRG